MNPRIKKLLQPELIALAALVLFALVPLDPTGSAASIRGTLGGQLVNIFIFAILALGLNVVLGYTGLLHLGIAAFFGIGAYITGILTVPGYPFQLGFTAALILSTLGAAAAGLVLGAPTLRLRGDYLALVTLGFGEVVRFSIRNLEEITGGTRGLNPVPPPELPGKLGAALDWAGDFRPFFFLSLGILCVVVWLLRNLENSRLGRAWMAIREDELAATCMGVSAARVKLSALAVAGGLAGMAGCLYATRLTSTAGPDAFDFNRSIIMLCCVILGGLGSLRGTLLGVLLLLGFDNILAPLADEWIQRAEINPTNNAFLTFSNWRLMIFGLALILMMRLRPEGLWPSERVRHELHEDKPLAPAARGAPA